MTEPVTTPVPVYVERLPENYEWFSDQIAGHHPSVYRDGKREIGILKKKGDLNILKLSQDGMRGIREVSLYRLIKGDRGNDAEDKASDPIKFWSKASAEDRRSLAGFAPAYHGQQKLVVDGAEHNFMKFRDVTMDYSKPAILDVKMGFRTYDDHASESKIRKETAKYPPQAKIGFRILGYRIHRDEEVKVRGKAWGMEFDETNVENGLREFFEGGRRSDWSEMMNSFVYQVHQISNFFQSQRSFKIFASSLLFLYETHENLHHKAMVYMIDFSHAYCTNGEPDRNYAGGVQNLLGHLNTIHPEYNEANGSAEFKKYYGVLGDPPHDPIIENSSSSPVPPYNPSPHSNSPDPSSLSRSPLINGNSPYSPADGSYVPSSSYSPRPVDPPGSEFFNSDGRSQENSNPPKRSSRED